ncbi:MAG: class I SAM-dependent methyltransferase [Planctomycetota bacterium]|nr:class I SAM-dependent methyltransferase [Planctomycetota bacterium]
MSERLHKSNPIGRFSDRAADYVKYRPSYPPEAIDAVLEGLTPSRGGTFRGPSRGAGFQPVRESRALQAADVGAGTGISAKLLAERGVEVFAIEPNTEMRNAGEKVPSPNKEGGRVTWRDGTAEATGLADASVDLVLCAQSYHWFEPVAACLEFGRVLRPGGRLALMWNDADESDPVAKGYYDLVRASSEGVGPTSHQTVAKEPRVEPPFAMSAMRRLRFRHEQRLDAEGLVGRAMSASYVPRTGEKAERLVEGLRRLHAEYVGADGCVGLVYGVWVYLNEPDQ